MKSLKLTAGLIVGLLSLSSQSYAGTVKINKDRLVKVIGVVGGDAINQAASIEKMSRESRKDIWMLINSPGGAVLPGMILVQAMEQAKKRGVTIRCVTGVMAASMAFIYLAHCNERYVLKSARLLFHPVSIGTSGARVQELIVGLDQTIKDEQGIMRYLQKSMGLSWKDFHRHYFAETFWTGTGLNNHTKGRWLIIVDDVKGAGDDLYRWRKPRSRFFNKNINSDVKEIIKRFLGGS